MSWPSDLSTFGSLRSCCAHFGVSPELWRAFTRAAGDPGDDFRLLAALPPTAVAASAESTTLDNGDQVTMIQAVQLGLVYRLARRKLHSESGLDMGLWKDPDPWNQNVEETQVPTTTTPVETTKDRKVKFSAVLDQGDETEFAVASESQKQAWLQVYANLTGDVPMEQEDPSVEQISALQKRLSMGQTPYADFGVFQPFGRRSHRTQIFRCYYSTPAGYYTKELPGPANYEQWKASFRVYRTALLMLEVISMATAVAYEDFVERLNRTYQGCWHLIVQADDLGRSEHLLRLRVNTELDIARGASAPPLWSDSNPWECLFRRLIKDTEFWSQQVHIPANAWLSHGSRGKLLTPAEAVASSVMQGGANAIKPETEAPKPNSEAAPWRSRNQRRADKKRKATHEADHQGIKGKGKGKTKGKTQACYAWNNNNGAWGKLIDELKKDWKREGRRFRDTDNKAKAWCYVPIWKWAGSKDRESKQAEEAGSSCKKEEKPDEGPPEEGDKDEASKEQKACMNGKLMTLRMYTLKRRFNFLHLYSGPEDPLGNAIRREAKANKMKVTVTSAEKSEGIDLLEEEPYKSYLDKAKAGFWDGVHSGFPCTYPYGFPDQPERRQLEADEGTLHASRSAHLLDAVLESCQDDIVKPVATLENPPPSEHPEHLSAWELPEVAKLAAKHKFIKVEFPTCKFQQSIPEGRRTYKPQMFGGLLPGLSSMRGRCNCGRAAHVPVVGKSRSEESARYPDELCDLYAKLLIMQFKRLAQAEFYRQREKDLKKEVEHSKRKSQVQQQDPRNRTPLPRRRGAKRAKSAEEGPKTKRAKKEPKEEGAVDEGEYTYEYTEEEVEEENTEVKSEQDTKEEEDEEFKPLEWKGGEGKFGLFKDSKSKASDPAKLNFVGGMRDPANAVSGMPGAQSLGLRMFAAWERITRSNPIPTETAAEYGTEGCELDAKLVERWRGELRKLVGAQGRPKASLKSKWTYQSPLQGDIIRAWTAKVGDVDVDIADCVDNGTPLGINRPIPTRGVFPPADKEAEQEALMDSAMQLARGSITNYASVRDNPDDTKVEVDRLEDLGFLVKITENTVRQEFPRGTISKLAIIVKERPDKSKKRRLIIDLRRSGGNAKARLEEKLILPRAVDAIGTLRQMAQLQGEITTVERQAMWKREIVLIDVSDAFPHLAVHRDELAHCVTPGLQNEEYFLFRALLFGYKTAPLLWSRIASWVARLLQSSVPLHEGQHQVYLDDSFWVLQGTLHRRNIVLSYILYTVSALGLAISTRKGERGAKVVWMGIEFRLISETEVLLTLPEKFLQDLQTRIQAWENKGMAATKDLRTVCGKLSWLGGVLPRTKWMLRVFYAVLSQREAEVRGGEEESRRARRDDDRHKEHLFVVIDALALKVTEVDAKELGFELGTSASQGTLEALALYVCLKHWGSKLAGMSIDLTVQSDSVTALAMAQRQSAASPALNFIGACLGIALELFKVEDIRLSHLPGVANKVADFLSRPSKWAGQAKPAELGDVKVSETAPRTEGFYPLDSPGRKPDLWGATGPDQGRGPWHTLFW
eukprot:s2500_g1.t1